MANIKISQKNIIEYAKIFYGLSYPIIETKNSNAIMPIRKILNILKEIVEKLSKEEKELLLKEISDYAKLDEEDTKYFERKSFSFFAKKEYLESRLKILKNQLRIKFGLE